MRVYFDASAFAKRYIDEAGSGAVLHWCEQATELVLAIIAVPELISALCRMQREGRLTAVQYEQIKRDLAADIEDVMIVDTSPQVVQRAIGILEASPLRGMDALHVAAALTASAEIFLSADKRQCEAAERAGLRVVLL